MPRLKSLFLSVLLGAVMAPALAAAQSNFEIVQKRSAISFEVTTTFNTIEGKASKFSGSLSIPGFPGDLATGTTATIIVDAKSLDTGHKGRDKDMHVDVLESEKYPEIKIAVKKIVAESTAFSYKVSADLTMHGVTKPVEFTCAVLPFAGDAGKQALSISGKVKVDITQFGMTAPSIVVNKVSNTVVIKWSLIAQQK